MMDPMQQGGVPPAQPQGLLGGVMPEDVEDAEADPGFVSARDWVVDRLFLSGSSDQAIARAVEQEGTQEGAMDAIAEIAYEVIGQADDQANPPMKEENLVPLAMFVLEQFWDIAAAALKVGEEEIDSAAIAGSFKIILLRYLRESGVDTTELEAAFNQLSAEDFRGLVSEIGGQMDQPAQSAPQAAPMPQGGM